MKQKTHVRFVSSAEWDRLEGHQKAIPSLKPKDMARIQRNINVDWMNLCLKLMRSKKKPLGESTWEPTVYSLDSELKASSFDRALEHALKAGR